MAEAPEHEELIGRLEDCTHNAHVLSICTEAATALRAALKEIAYLDEQNEKHAGIAEKALLRAEAAEAEVTRLREALAHIAAIDPVEAALDPECATAIARRAIRSRAGAAVEVRGKE